MKRITQYIAVISVFLVAFLGLHKAWEELVDHTIVKWTFLYFDNGAYFRIAVAIVLSMLLYNSRKIKWNSVEVYVCILLLWLYYRFFNKHWNFEELYSVVTYFDLLLCPMLLCVLGKGFDSYKKVKDSGLPKAITDNPIETEYEDMLGRKLSVESFAKFLVDSVNMGVCNQTAFSISINAGWGDGKTSFMNLVKEYVKNDCNNRSFEFVNFEPWMRPTNILSEFFDLLQKKVYPSNILLSNSIKRYASVLEGTKASLASRLLLAIYSNKSIGQRFDIIREGLLRIDKTYVIVIDDMDRLTGNEILEVFRLIRSSANFPHLVFILLYDKQYVLDALREIGTQLKDSFLGKFVNTEYPLPSYDTDALSTIAKKVSKTFLGKDDCAKFDNFLDEKYIGESQSIPFMVLANPRDVKRWLVSMSLNYKNLMENAEVEDFALLELLMLKYHLIYNALKYNYELYLINRYCGYVLWNENMELSDVEKMMNRRKKNIYKEKFFQDLNADDQELVRIILNRLFPGRTNPLATKHINNRIFFKRYFFLCLQNNEISSNDYKQLITNENFKYIKTYIVANKVKGESIIINIERDTINDEPYVLRNKIRAIFLIGALLGAASSPDFIRGLVGKLPEEERNGVLYGALTENGASKWAMLFFSQLYSGHKYEDKWAQIITEEESTKAACEIFKQVLNSDMSISEIYDYYWHTNTYENKQRKVNEKVTEILKAYIKQNPEKMLYFLIYSDREGKYYLSDYVKDFYSDNDGMLNEFANDNSPAVCEFKDFVSQLKENDNKPIAFQFKCILTQ